MEIMIFSDVFLLVLIKTVTLAQQPEKKDFMQSWKKTTNNIKIQTEQAKTQKW